VAGDINHVSIHRAPRRTPRQHRGPPAPPPQIGHRPQTPPPARRSESVGIRASRHHGTGSQTKSFSNIAAAADAAIQQDLNTVAYRRHNFRQNTQSRRDAVELPPTMIGHYQPVSSNIDSTSS